MFGLASGLVHAERSKAFEETAWRQLLELRYAPYASNHDVLETQMAQLPEPSRYWRTASELKATRPEGARPLDGVHLVLDPGHIGGVWAAHEWRNFRIEEGDHWVREGELVLEVATRARERLLNLGAEVTLTRLSANPVNPKKPYKYLQQVAESMELPVTTDIEAQIEYGKTLQAKAVRMAIIEGDLVERARRINEEIQPDAVISLHINAAPWPKQSPSDVPGQRLVESNHLHVLIFGCASESELSSKTQRRQTWVKLSNGSGVEELRLGDALAQSLSEATGLPASEYANKNAVRCLPRQPYVWARNLLLLRSVECPVVLLEPYVANSQTAYRRIQEALEARRLGKSLAEDDIVVEYAEAVVDGLLRAYR